MYFLRRTLSFAVAFCVLSGAISAQNNKKLDPDAGYIPTVAPADKTKKKKGDDVTQASASARTAIGGDGRHEPARVSGHAFVG